MKILLLGGGGREHAMGWSLSRNPECKKLYIAPGNAGTRQIGENVALKENDFEDIKEFVSANNINMVITGPEKPLVNGIVDYFANNKELKNIPVLGPDQAAARLEGSKSFAKQFMQKHGIPTGKFATFRADEIEEAKKAVNEQKPPYVLKADGLAAGKGVTICEHKEEAYQTLEDYFIKETLGGAGKNVILEEYLQGEELSIFIMTDGKDYIILPDARDYKRIGEGDTGPNTGGMGAISPAPGIDEEFMHKVKERIIERTIKGIQEEGFHYKGFLYLGLINVEGEPHVLEYNIRLGDPEAEVIIPRLGRDLLELSNRTFSGALSSIDPEIKTKAGATVVMASGGYPGAYEKGKVITGLDKVSNSHVFHAGTQLSGNDVVTSGGRVLSVTSLGENLNAALETCYQDVERIKFENAYYRKDIGGNLANK